MPTQSPTKVIIQHHQQEGRTDSFSLHFHLRVEFSIGRQYSLGPMSQPVLEQTLREWVADRDAFLKRHFGWDAATIDRQIRSHGKAHGHGKANPLGNITLSDLGL